MAEGSQVELNNVTKEFEIEGSISKSYVQFVFAKNISEDLSSKLYFNLVNNFGQAFKLF